MKLRITTGERLHDRDLIVSQRICDREGEARRGCRKLVERWRLECRRLGAAQQYGFDRTEFDPNLPRGLRTKITVVVVPRCTLQGQEGALVSSATAGEELARIALGERLTSSAA